MRCIKQIPLKGFDFMNTNADLYKLFAHPATKVVAAFLEKGRDTYSKAHSLASMSQMPLLKWIS